MMTSKLSAAVVSKVAKRGLANSSAGLGGRGPDVSSVSPSVPLGLTSSAASFAPAR